MRSDWRLKFTQLWWLVLPVLCGRLSAAVITLPVVADTSLFESKADFNLGGTTLVSGTNQQVSRARGLIRFDLSSLPADAVVTGVEVLLYCSRQPDPDQHGGPVPSDFSLHRMLVGWGEGTSGSATGSVAMAGDATWNERHYQAISWGTPGGLSGTDFSADASATTSVENVGLYAWGSSTELIGDVNAWRANPSSNFGFMLVNQSEGSPGSGRRFASREQSSELNPAPRLVVTFIPEPSAPGLVMVGVTVVALVRRRVRD
jgi:hypothetical protein